MTRKSLNKQKSKTASKKEEEYDTLHIQGLSESVERAVRDLKVRTAFKTILTCLTKVNTPTDPVNTKGVVYKIPCECGRVYVGETGRTLKQRITEHK